MMKSHEIKAELMKRNLTMSSFAVEIGVSTTTVFEEIRQRAPRSAWVRRAIASRIGMSVEQVFGAERARPKRRAA